MDPQFEANPNAPLTGASATVNQQGLLAIIWISFSFATLFVTLRLVVRWRQNRTLLPDDYCMIFAWLSLLTMGILQTEQMESLWYITYLQHGRVAPNEETAEQSYQISRWQFPIIKLFWTVLWSVKASFMAVFFRLVQPMPVLRRLWYCVAAFVVLAYIGCWISSALTCSPPSDYFKPGMCDTPSELSRQRFNVLFSTIVDVVSDLLIMALPIAVLPSLQLDKRRKIGLGVAFSLGAIIIVVAIIRMTQVIIGDNVDLVGLAIWGAVESSTAAIVGSLPPLKALITREVKKYSSGAKSGQKYAGGVNQNSSSVGYNPDSTSRTVMVAESIPLDEMHRSAQLDGRIFVQKTYDTHYDRASSSRSRDDDEAGIVSK